MDFLTRRATRRIRVSHDLHSRSLSLISRSSTTGFRESFEISLTDKRKRIAVPHDLNHSLNLEAIIISR